MHSSRVPGRASLSESSYSPPTLKYFQHAHFVPKMGVGKAGRALFGPWVKTSKEALITETTVRTTGPVFRRTLGRERHRYSIIRRYFQHAHFIPLVGVGKEWRTLFGPWRCKKSTRCWNYVEHYWPCVGGLSTVNAIGTQSRDPKTWD